MEGYPKISVDRLRSVYEELEDAAGAEGQEALRALLDPDPALALFVREHAVKLIEAFPADKREGMTADEFLEYNVSAGVLGALLIGYVVGIQTAREESDGI